MRKVDEEDDFFDIIGFSDFDDILSLGDEED